MAALKVLRLGRIINLLQLNTHSIGADVAGIVRLQGKLPQLRQSFLYANKPMDCIYSWWRKNMLPLPALHWLSYLSELAANKHNITDTYPYLQNRYYFQKWLDQETKQMFADLWQSHLGILEQVLQFSDVHLLIQPPALKISIKTFQHLWLSTMYRLVVS